MDIIINNDSIKRDDVSIAIDRKVKISGLLAYLSPEDLQTLIALLTFADCSGRCELSVRIMGQTLNLSENGVRRRLSRLCNLRWNGKPIVVKESGRECGKFISGVYQVISLDGIRLISEDQTNVSDAIDRQTLNHNGCNGNGSSVEYGVQNIDAQKQKNGPDSEKCAPTSGDTSIIEHKDTCVVSNVVNNINNKHNTTTQGSPTLKCGQRFHRLISSFKRSEGLPLGSFQGSNGT